MIPDFRPLPPPPGAGPGDAERKEARTRIGLNSCRAYHQGIGHLGLAARWNLVAKRGSGEHIRNVIIDMEVFYGG